MLKHFEGARLGIFVFIGTVLIILSILLIGNKDALFVSSINVKAYFSEVEGLKSGAPVRLSGYDIGSVSDISLAPDTSGQVIVSMRVESSVQHFVRLDSEATIETEGLVGKKIISITPGSTKFEIVQDGGVIKSTDPVNIAEIIEETRGVISNLRVMTKDFSEITTKVNEGTGTVGKIFNDEELYYAAVDLTQSADQSLDVITTRLDEISNYIAELGKGMNTIMENVDSSVVNIKDITDKVNRGEGALGALIADESLYDSVKTIVTNLVETSESASSGASKFVESMEALKHNWLFKSYFEERGYWDKAEYETEINVKLKKLEEEQARLDKKIEELKELEERIKSLQQE